ncbi:ribosomal protein L7/L12 [Streptomyces sp. RPT161]|uniref:ribosomal protein L7/L12 n=1 Tax=Streptomyces sp. RPT161 TaxID=3015993 RepID=UPI0022B8DBFA|nr:ribosomal protein L7/L12 [Streptomyces sp. RPT161]
MFTNFDLLERRLVRVEKKLDLIMEHLGIQVDQPELREVREFIQEGKMLNAIKAYREATGVGLKEAKAAVDQLASQA